MTLSSIQLVTETEAKAEGRVEEARVQATAIVDEAKEKVKTINEYYRQKAASENKRLMQEAQTQAERDIAAVNEKMAVQRSELETKAKQQLQSAAGLIVERIVSG